MWLLELNAILALPFFETESSLTKPKSRLHNLASGNPECSDTAAIMSDLWPCRFDRRRVSFDLPGMSALPGTRHYGYRSRYYYCKYVNTKSRTLPAPISTYVHVRNCAEKIRIPAAGEVYVDEIGSVPQDLVYYCDHFRYNLFFQAVSAGQRKS